MAPVQNSIAPHWLKSVCVYEVEGVLFIKTEKEHVISAEPSSQILNEIVGKRSVCRMVAREH